MVTTYDAKTLNPTGEIILPKGRFLVVPKKYNAQISSDGRYLYSFNMDPAFGLSLVDLKENRYVGEIETGGCSLAYPDRRQQRRLALPGRLVRPHHHRRRRQGLDRGRHALLRRRDRSGVRARGHVPPGKKAFFVSYDGWVYPVALDGKPVVGERWKLQGEGEEGWRPGGWQLAAYHAPTDRLFVLMHEGGLWTHKQAGTEVWVYDAATRQAAPASAAGAPVDLARGQHATTSP